MVTKSIASVASYYNAMRGVAPVYIDAHEAAAGVISGGGGQNGPAQFFLNGDWYIDRPLWIWDQREILPARVLSASIKFYPFKWVDAPGVDYVMQIGYPDFPHYPPVAEDYDYLQYYGDTLLCHDSDIPVNRNGFSLEVEIDPAWVRLGDITKLMVRTSDDIAGNPVSNMTGLQILGHGVTFGEEPPTLTVVCEEGTPLPPPTRCPKCWPWWWLLVAGGAGGLAGYWIRKNQEQKYQRK